MYKLYTLVLLLVINGCSSVTSNEVIKLDSQSITTVSPKIIEEKLEQTPFDIWERIRLELTLVIPQDQIAATSLYRERLYKNQSAVNRISKSGQRYLHHTLTRAEELGLPVELALLPFVESEFDPYAKSVDGVLNQWGTKDSTFGIFTMDDGTIWSMNISWALPEVWPGSVYGLEIGIVGTEGVIDIEDTHRDLVLASNIAQGAGYTSREYAPPQGRHVDFLTSYPAGDIQGGQFWGPMREETNTWYTRLCTDQATPHATAQDGHRNLLMTMAMDLSAKEGKEIVLPSRMDDIF